jgi:hypothetical protein
MLQQIIALIVICFFLVRLFLQKRKKQISANEFGFWLFFWSAAVLAILSIKWIDRFVFGLGFSASGIEVLLYILVLVLVYLVFRLRLRMEKMDRSITELTREMALKNKQ